MVDHSQLYGSLLFDTEIDSSSLVLKVDSLVLALFAILNLDLDLDLVHMSASVHAYSWAWQV